MSVIQARVVPQNGERHSQLPRNPTSLSSTLLFIILIVDMYKTKTLCILATHKVRMFKGQGRPKHRHLKNPKNRQKKFNSAKRLRWLSVPWNSIFQCLWSLLSFFLVYDIRFSKNPLEIALLLLIGLLICTWFSAIYYAPINVKPQRGEGEAGHRRGIWPRFIFSVQMPNPRDVINFQKSTSLTQMSRPTGLNDQKPLPRADFLRQMSRLCPPPLRLNIDKCSNSFVMAGEYIFLSTAQNFHFTRRECVVLVWMIRAH